MKNKIEKLEKEIEQFSSTISELYKQRETLTQKILNIQGEVRARKDEIANIQLSENPNDWNVLLFEDGGGSGIYRKAKEMVANLGLWMSGYFPETNQKSISVMLIKDDPENLEKTLNGLNEILPYIKPLKANVGEGLEKFNISAKVIGVFEHTCSANGIFKLILPQNDKIFLQRITYNRPTKIKDFDSLKEALEYIQEHHYYQTKEDRDGI